MTFIFHPGSDVGQRVVDLALSWEVSARSASLKQELPPWFCLREGGNESGE